MVELGEVCELVRGITYGKDDEVKEDGFKVLRANNINLDSSLNFEDIKEISKNLNFSEDKKLRKDDIFICLASGSKSHIGKVAFIETDTDYYFGSFMGVVRINQNDKAISKYIFQQLKNSKFNDYLRNEINGVNINNLNSKILSTYKIPLPPLSVQQEIVEQIEVKQKAIDAAKAVIESLERERRYFGQALRKLEGVELGEVCEIEKGTSITKKLITDGDIPVIAGGQQPAYYHNVSNREGKTITISGSGAYAGFVNYFEIPIFASDCSTIKSKDENKLMTKFIFRYLKTRQEDIYKLQMGMGQPHVYSKDLAKLKIPLPSLEIQKKLVAEAEREQKIIDANKELIEIMEGKIEELTAKKKNLPKMKEAERVLEFIRTFRHSLSSDISATQEYSFKAYVVPKIGNHRNSSDVAIEFVRFDPNNADEMEKYEKMIVGIKEKSILVANQGKHKPAKVLKGLVMNDQSSFMKNNNKSLTVFENFKIRRVYDEKTETWYFSVIDIVAALTEQNDFKKAQSYWTTLKNRLKKEGSEVVTKCDKLKLQSVDGKFYKTDVANAETLLRLIQSVPRKKAEPIKLWLAKVGYERMQEMNDPEQALNRSREYWQKQGRSEKWIQQRMMGQETRNNLL
ncbi:hypothetical protein CHS0354_000725 [Potamilus streckersoni]|uniref:Bro-N domain-containing protein n=1 Tax=Potamilus streckersoni TaxID=2493646 RepID=A0AAE0T832_9BIVA|nr:hypothetical protein CHS0354_000725 [Potamilus streckersoni]